MYIYVHIPRIYINNVYTHHMKEEHVATLRKIKHTNIINLIEFLR